jgi:hypothetical protein
MAGQNETPSAGSGNGARPLVASSEAESTVAEDLVAIREQTREILELVRSLVSLLLPKDSGDGPKLEDLIAALVAQQRDILVAIRQIQADLLVLLERSGGSGDKPSNGLGRTNGSAPA